MGWAQLFSTNACKSALAIILELILKTSRLFKFLCGLLFCLAISLNATASNTIIFQGAATLQYTGTYDLIVGTGTLPAAGDGSGSYKLMGTAVLTNVSSKPLNYNICAYDSNTTQKCLPSNTRPESISYIDNTMYYTYPTTFGPNCSLDNNGSSACMQSSYRAQYVNGALAGSAPKTLAPGAQAVIRVATAGRVWIPNIGVLPNTNPSVIGGAVTLVICQTTSDCNSTSDYKILPVVFPTAPKTRTCTLSTQRLIWDLGVFTQTELPYVGSKTAIANKTFTVGCDAMNMKMSLAISGYAPDDGQTFHSTSGDAAGVTAQFFLDNDLAPFKVGEQRVPTYPNVSQQRNYSIGVQLTKTKDLVPGPVSFVAALEVTYP